MKQKLCNIYCNQETIDKLFKILKTEYPVWKFEIMGEEDGDILYVSTMGRINIFNDERYFHQMNGFIQGVFATLQFLNQNELDRKKA